MADCTISGVILDSNNALAAGIRVYCVKLIGADLITDAEQKLIATSTVAGVVSFVLPQGSTAYLSGNFFVNGTTFNVNDGIALSIPASSTVDLIDLAAVASFPDDGAIVQDDGVALPLRIGTFNFGAGIAAVPGAAGVATITADIASTEAVQDALASFFVDSGAYDWTYSDLNNRVELVIAPATTSVNGLFSAADKTLLDAVPATYALASALTSEISTRGAADTVLQSNITAEANARAAADALLLVKASNLSDLTNAGTARTNLGLGSGDSPTFAGLGVGAAPYSSGGIHVNNTGGAALHLKAGAAGNTHLLAAYETSAGQIRAVIDAQGQYYTNGWLTVSGAFSATQDVNGNIVTFTGGGSGLATMVDVVADVQYAIVAKAYNSTSPAGTNYVGLDKDGNFTFAISADGSHWFGAGATHASMDVGIKRVSAGLLEINTTVAATLADLRLRHLTVEGVTSTGATGTGAFVFATSPTLVTPVLGVASATSLIVATGATSTGAIDLLINPTTKASGNLIEAQINGSNRFSVSSTGLITGTAGLSVLQGITAGAIQISSGSGYTWASGTSINQQGSGIITLFNNGGTDFGRLQFGGTSASFPSLKRSGTVLQHRTASDSAYAEVDALEYRASGTKVLGGRGAALTAADAGTINSGDATTDAVIANMRTRINELEARLGSAAGHGLFTT